MCVSIVFPVFFAPFLSHLLYFKLSFLEGFGSLLLILYFLFCCNCSSESRNEGRVQTVRECFIHVFKN